MRPKRHALLLMLDEFPQLGRLPFFETAMGAMAGYGIKANIVCQSLNHITRAYGRDNVILDNVHIVTTFAAADMETAKRIAEMTGEIWEMRPQESEHRPRNILGPRKGTITHREERRPLMLPGDVRKLGRDEQLIFVTGSKPIRAKKLSFDREPVFQKRLLAPKGESVQLSIFHDWLNVGPVGHLPREKKQKPSSSAASKSPTPPAPPPPAPASKPTPTPTRAPAPAPTAAVRKGQIDLFEPKPGSISEQALAGFRTLTVQAPADFPAEPSAPEPSPEQPTLPPRAPPAPLTGI
jgi:type IV secretion system protein VirD4